MFSLFCNQVSFRNVSLFYILLFSVPKPLKSALQAESDQVWTNLVARDLLWSDPGQSCDLGLFGFLFHFLSFSYFAKHIFLLLSISYFFPFACFLCRLHRSSCSRSWSVQNRSGCRESVYGQKQSSAHCPRTRMRFARM
jgi:hypothetical protein